MPLASRGRWIWLALRAIGFPEHIILAIQALYRDNFHFTSGPHGLIFAFCAGSGVRQGCPLSSLIFVMIIDCINRAIFNLLGCRDLILANVDGLAIVLHDLWAIGQVIATIFLRIGRISSLSQFAKVYLYSFVEV